MAIVCDPTVLMVRMGGRIEAGDGDRRSVEAPIGGVGGQFGWSVEDAREDFDLDVAVAH